MKTLEQTRAAHALERVQKLVEASDELTKKYRSYVERLGPAIVMNGLGQALATECAAASVTPHTSEERAHHQLYQNVHEWLCRPGEGIYPEAADLLGAIVSQQEPDYLRAQAEALSWLAWHKKFCRAMLPRSEQAE